MADNFQNTVASLFQGMEDFITSKTVVGEPVYIGDTILLPLIEVSFGMAASNKNEDRRNTNGGGMGGKMAPTAVMIIRGGQTRVIDIKNQDGLTRLMDLVPDLVERFKSGDPAKDEDVKKAVDEMSAKKETF